MSLLTDSSSGIRHWFRMILPLVLLSLSGQGSAAEVYVFDDAVLSTTGYSVTVRNQSTSVTGVALSNIALGLSVPTSLILGVSAPSGWSWTIAPGPSSGFDSSGARLLVSQVSFQADTTTGLFPGDTVTFGFTLDMAVLGDPTLYPLAAHYATYARGLYDSSGTHIRPAGPGGEDRYLAPDFTAVVPLPAALWLFGSGLLGAMVLMRRTPV